MATRIRLKKVGRKKQPSFRIVVAGGMHARGGRITETIGKYNPRTQPSYIEVDAGRALHWLREGAQMSESVNSLFRKAGILEKYAKGLEAEGVVVIGDRQGKTRLAGSAAAPPPDTAAAEPKAEKAKPEAKAAPAPEAAGESGSGTDTPAPDTAGEAKPAKATKAKAAEAETTEADAPTSEAEPGAGADEAEDKQDGES